MEDNGEKRYVSWIAFGFFVTIALVSIGAVFGFALASYNISNDNRVSIGKIEATMVSMDKTLVKIEAVTDTLKLLK